IQAIERIFLCVSWWCAQEEETQAEECGDMRRPGSHVGRTHALESRHTEPPISFRGRGRYWLGKGAESPLRGAQIPPAITCVKWPCLRYKMELTLVGSVA